MDLGHVLSVIHLVLNVFVKRWLLFGELFTRRPGGVRCPGVNLYLWEADKTYGGPT